MPPDEQKALQERVKNMSPEELKQFQKQQCLFCQIVAGKVNARRVYDDDKVIAVLDINPANPGHVLLLPREHYQIMPQMPDDETAHLFNIAKGISGAILRAFQVPGTNLFVANGASAGQKAQHFMVHIIPRSDGDKINLTVPEFQISEQNMSVIHKRIMEFMTGALAMAPDTEPKHELPEPQAAEQIVEKQPEQEQSMQVVSPSKIAKEPESDDDPDRIPSAKIVEGEKKHSHKKKQHSRERDLDDLADRLG